MKKIILLLIFFSFSIGQTSHVIKRRGLPHLEFKGKINSGNQSEGKGSFVSINGDTTRIWKGGFKGGYFHGSGSYQYVVANNSQLSFTSNSTFINGSLEGVNIRHFANGYKIEFEYKNDKRISSKIFTDQGFISLKTQYKNGKPFKAEGFNEDGSRFVDEYLNDSNGEYRETYYFADGKYVIGKYNSNDKKIGKWKFFRKDGSASGEVIFSKDGNEQVLSDIQYPTKSTSTNNKAYSRSSRSEIDSSIFYILGGLGLIFALIYFNQSKVRGLKFKVTIKGSKYDYVDLSSNEPKSIEPREIMKKITFNAKKLHFEPMINLLLFLLIIPAAFGFVMSPWLGGVIAVVGFIILVVPFLSLRRAAQKSFIEYDLDEKAQKRFEHIVDCFKLVEESCDPGYFSINKAAPIADDKAGFSGLLFHKTKDDYISSNINFISFCIGYSGLFLPDAIYIAVSLHDSEAHCRMFNYDKISATFRKVSKKTENKLSDHEQTGQTWRHPRKDGQADKRFSENPPVYIVNEGRITFGKNVYDDISSVKLAKAFTTKFNKLPTLSKAAKKTENLTIDQLPKAPYDSMIENVSYLLFAMGLSDSNEQLTKDENLMIISMQGLFFEGSDDLDIKEIINRIADDADFQDIIWSDNLLGAIGYIANNLDETRQNLLQNLIERMASVDGKVDDGEKQIIEYLKLYFNNRKIKYMPFFKDDINLNIMGILMLASAQPDSVFEEGFYYYPKATSSLQKFVDWQKMRLENIKKLKKAGKLDETYQIGEFIKLYQTIEYCYEKMSEKEKVKIRETLDSIIEEVEGDDPDATNYGSHFRFIKIMFQ